MYFSPLWNSGLGNLLFYFLFCFVLLIPKLLLGKIVQVNQKFSGVSLTRGLRGTKLERRRVIQPSSSDLQPHFGAQMPGLGQLWSSLPACPLHWKPHVKHWHLHPYLSLHVEILFTQLPNVLCPSRLHFFFLWKPLKLLWILFFPLLSFPNPLAGPLGFALPLGHHGPSHCPLPCELWRQFPWWPSCFKAFWSSLFSRKLPGWLLRLGSHFPPCIKVSNGFPLYLELNVKFSPWPIQRPPSLVELPFHAGHHAAVSSQAGSTLWPQVFLLLGRLSS